MLDLRLETDRRTYERSLSLMLCHALHTLYPQSAPRFEYSVGSGVFVTLKGVSLNHADIVAIHAEMQRLCDENVPIEKKTMSRTEAIAYFESIGRTDKAEQLRLQSADTLVLHGIRGTWDHSFGAYAESAGEIRLFELIPDFQGLVMQIPNAADPGRVLPYVYRPKHLSAFSQSDTWCNMLGVRNATDLNSFMQNGSMREFIRVNEALHDSSIAAIANEIVQQNKRIVLVAGPSSSGKTTFAARLGVHLRVRGKQFLRVSMDNYYRPRNELVPDENGRYDFETIDALDIPLLKAQLTKLLQGESVEMPVYSFKTGMRESSTKAKISPDCVVIVEGIHALNPLLCEGLDMNVIHRVFISALTCINMDDHSRIHTTDVRLLRRIVRDYQYRGTLPKDTILMWPDVRAGEEKWIFPYQETADSVFNTALHYEIPVLKMCADPLLKQIDDAECADTVENLLNLLSCFPTFDTEMMDEIPPLSLLREFIGGCTAEK